MFIRVLKAGGVMPLPSIASSGSILRLQIVPIDGQAWRFAQSTSSLSTRGRLGSGGLPTNMTSIQPRANMHATFGSPTGLEANVGSAITSTTIQNGAQIFYPFVDWYATVTGTVAAGWDMEMDLAIGVPVKSITVLAASAGMPYAVGDNICDPRFGAAVAW